MTPARRKSLFLFILLMGSILRLYGLGRWQRTSDESHYRGDMSNVMVWLKHGGFRDHSVHHDKGAPHGLVAPLIAFVTARSTDIFFRFLQPASDYERHNFLARLGYVLFSIALLIVLFGLGRDLYGDSIGLVLMLFAALSPFFINWGRSEYLDGPMTVFLLAGWWVLWRVPAMPQQRQQVMGTVLAAALGALALGTKWSAMTLLPFMAVLPLLLFWAREPEGSLSWAWILTAVLVFAGVVFSLCLLSPESFRWALFPASVPRQDDMRTFTLASAATDLFSGLLRRNSDLMVYLYWGGPLFIAVLGLFGFITRRFSRVSRRDVFLLSLFLSGLVSRCLLPTVPSEWRAEYWVSVLFLIGGLLLEPLSPKQLWIGSILCAALALPLSIQQGLRLQTPIVSYHGDENPFLHELPEFDEHERLFPKR